MSATSMTQEAPVAINRVKITVGNSLNRQLSSSRSTANSSSWGPTNSKEISVALAVSDLPSSNIKLSDLCAPKARPGRGRKKTLPSAGEQQSNQGNSSSIPPAPGNTSTNPSTKRPLLESIPEKRAPRSSGPRVEFVNGKMIIKESSLELSQDGIYGDDDYVYEEVTEEANQSSTTYSSFSKKVKSAKWGVQETWLFYQALRQCGTDFSLMLTFFPGRTRDSLKRKFLREEKAHPQLVKQAITFGLPLDMNVYSALFGDHLMDPAGASNAAGASRAADGSSSSSSSHLPAMLSNAVNATKQVETSGNRGSEILRLREAEDDSRITKVVMV